MKHRWSCFWFLIAAQSLSDRRLALWKAEAVRDGLHAQGWTWQTASKGVPEAEARVNRALVRRNKYKKRACEKCRSAVRRLEA